MELRVDKESTIASDALKFQEKIRANFLVTEAPGKNLEFSSNPFFGDKSEMHSENSVPQTPLLGDATTTLIRLQVHNRQTVHPSAPTDRAHPGR
jgi:hypothetical protein